MFRNPNLEERAKYSSHTLISVGQAPSLYHDTEHTHQNAYVSDLNLSREPTCSIATDLPLWSREILKISHETTYSILTGMGGRAKNAQYSDEHTMCRKHAGQPLMIALLNTTNRKHVSLTFEVSHSPMYWLKSLRKKPHLATAASSAMAARLNDTFT